MLSGSIDYSEYVTCGYIKAKFPVLPDKPLAEHGAYLWIDGLKRPRCTSNFIYLSLGHSDIRDNDAARGLLENIEMLGGKVTRLDFCIDYLGKLDFTAFYELNDNQEKPNPSMVITPTGATVYIGARSSARMLRVYDKRGEILAKKKCDVGFDITRVELEVKRNMVARYLSLFMSGNLQAILSDMQSVGGLRGFCQEMKPSRPVEITDKSGDMWSFIRRYKRLLRTAYLDDRCQFFDTIGVNNVDTKID